MADKDIILPNVTALLGGVTRKRNTDRRDNARLAKGVPFAECEICGATYSADDECEWCD
jgi:hypothetical protein